MPQMHPLPTPCRYGIHCTRPDCYYTHPKGTKKVLQQDQEHQICFFGRSCFRKVCLSEHPEGRIMEQLRPGFDYCAACALVRPTEIARVSAAFRSAFPAPDEGKDRCEFVAAVPMSIAFQDWKRYRGISMSGTPNGVPSTPEKIQLFPRTRKGERLLQNRAICSGLRWSPTPYRPWKTLERMATHDQFWEENQAMYLLCAGYEMAPPEKGVCIELSVTSTVEDEDDRDAVKAGTRVAGKVLGLPDAQDQKWFVFHMSQLEESPDEPLFVTVKTIIDASKMPEPYRPPGSRPLSAPVQKLTSPATVEFPHRLPNALSSTVPAAKQPARIPPIGMAPAYSSSILSNAPVMPRSSSAPTPVAYSPSPAPAMSFGSSIEAIGSPSPSNRSLMKMGVRAVSDQTRLKSFPISTSFPPRPPPQLVAPVVDELGKLLEKLNMSKYRQTFDDKQVDYKTLENMKNEEEVSGIGIPLGPRIKLMNELGIERSA